MGVFKVAGARATVARSPAGRG